MRIAWTRVGALLLCAGLLAAEPAPFDVRAATAAADAPFAAMMHLREADRASADRDWTRAAALYTAVLRTSPELAPARHGLADAALALGEPQRALDALGSLPAPVTRTLAALQLGRLESPDTDLLAAFEAHRDPRLLNALGEWRDDRGDGPGARRAFMRANSLQRPGLAHNNLGMSFLREGDLGRAQSAFDTAVAADADDTVFARNARLCALKRGDYARALSGLRGEAAAPLLREAGAGALSRGEVELAALLLERADALSVRHDPRTAALLGRLGEKLDHQAADPDEHAQRHRQ